MKNNKNIALIGILISILITSCLKDDKNFSIGLSNPETSLFNVRSLYKGTTLELNATVLSEAKYFKGIIVSSKEGNNMPKNLIAVQNTWRNQTRGILLEVDNSIPYRFGDSVIVNLENAKLVSQDDLMTIQNLKSDNIQIINSDNTVQSRPVSILALQVNFANYESTYVDVTADLETEPANGTPIKGNKILIDGDQNKLSLFTDESASFANQPIAPSATFIGVPIKNNKEIQLRLQSYAGMAFPSGRIYTGWPETFENPTGPKGSYNMTAINNNMAFHTGEWHLFQSIIGDTQGRDRIVSGKYAIRFQQNLTVPSYLQMNFDVPTGASKITFWYGSYWTDRSCSFMVEYSQDQGLTWTKMGETVTDAHTTTESLTAKQAIYLMNVQGPTRFRITKLGLGSSSNIISNGRLGIDDISIFRSY